MFAILVTLSCFLAGLFCLVLNYFRIILILRIDIFVCGWIVLTLLPALVFILYHQHEKLLAERIARIDEEMDQGCYHFQFDTKPRKRIPKVADDEVDFDDYGCGCEWDRERHDLVKVVPED